MILGVDTGGTFTDFALLTDSSTLQTHKVLSTPDAPERAILQGIAEMGLGQKVAAGEVKIIHGSTVATNAALEGKGVPTAYITNQGFEDILSIGRQTRPQLYHLESPPQPIPVPVELCFGIKGRVDAQSNIIEAIDFEEIDALIIHLEQLKPQAIAINLLFSFLDSSHEIALESYLLENLSWQPFICRSSFVLPEYKEFERGIATWLNASLGPLVKDYLLRLKAGTEPSPVAVMQSSGGTIGAELAAEKAVNLLLSGPAGGLAAASFLAHNLNQAHLMTFDMGGTSTDVALISDGKINLSNEGQIGHFPVAVPMVDMHTIGAGGGSIALVDAGNLLTVGPTSAGAKPGPACYGLGGTQATVSDANLVLGRLLPEAFMGGALSLDEQASLSAIKDISSKLALTSKESAKGIISLANEHMARALRVISVERGHDPKDFRLCCFGGAGGLHICALADALEMERALVPMHAGVLSALGMFLAPVERQLSLTHQKPLRNIDSKHLNEIIEKLKVEAIQQLSLEVDNTQEITLELSLDLRYTGQSTCLNLPMLSLSWEQPENIEQDFHQLHESRYGHYLSTGIELVNIRLSARAKTLAYQQAALPKLAPAKPIKQADLYGYTQAVPVYQRHLLSPQQLIQGPALITETNSSTLIDANWSALVDTYGNLFLEKDTKGRLTD